MLGATPVASPVPDPVLLLWPTPLIEQFGDSLRPTCRGPTNPLPPALAAALKDKHQNNNEAGPPPILQTMESAGPQYAPLSHNTSPPLHMMSSNLDAPAHITDHGVPSNLRNAEDHPFDQVLPGQEQVDLLKDTPYEVVYSSFPDPWAPGTPVPDAFELALDQPLDAQPGPVFSEEQQQDEGYAMITFADSYHILKTPNLMVGRDQSFLQRYQQQQKEERRQRKIQRNHTRRALVDYAKEPSQPSQPGDDAALYPSSASADGDVLEGRPARGLLSHYSEQGGPVAYDPPPDDVANHFHRRERNRMKPSSSSATSIAPQDLHFDTITLSAQDGQVYTGPSAADDGENWALLPVHPADPDDIKNISREHLIFSYNQDNHRWEVHVVGNNAYIGNTLYHRGDANIPLEHGTEINISSLSIIFRLPPTVDTNDSIEPDEDADEQSSAEMAIDPESSPDRRLSNGSVGDEEEDDLEEPEQLAQKPIKLKLKAPKAPKAPIKASPSGKGKANGKEKSAKAAGKSKVIDPRLTEPSESAKQPDKGKKPQEVTAATGVEDEEAEAAKADTNASSRPINILPGSILESLAPDQMPEKRKGPGRPPKNGVLSKRDERAVTRRRKEYERLNMPVPDFNQILAEVRIEQKAKDAAAKGNKLRAGSADAVETTEAAEQPADGVTGQGHSRDSQASQSADPAAGQTGPSALPRRPFRSPSPMKPAEEFTEEELKKPPPNYAYLLDEVLRDVGQADLQTIYDKFQKRWPYYKYTVTTNGWQSSIRHNLSQNGRFKAIGKVGKGQLWAIDYTVALDDESKKKKTPPPPRQPQVPMGNGSMPPGMPQYPHGPPQFAPRYNNTQPVYNPGQGQYSSPYGTHPGPYPPPPGLPPSRMPMMNGKPMAPIAQGSYMQQPQNSAQPSQQAAQPLTPIQLITQEIMAFRGVYLARWPDNSTEFNAENTKLFAAVNYFSDLFHGSGSGSSAQHPGDDVLNSEPYVSLKAIFDRHTAPAGNPGDPKNTANAQGQGTTITAGENGVAGAQSNGQPTPEQRAQAVQLIAKYPDGRIPAPQTNGVPNVSQDVEQSVASQTAAAVAQTAAGPHGSHVPPVTSADSNGHQMAPVTSTNINGHTDMQQPTGLAALSAAIAGQDEQPTMTAAPVTADAPQQASMTPPLHQTANGSSQQSPSTEQPRPVSAGIKRGAEDVDMQDAESQAKRQRTE